MLSSLSFVEKQEAYRFLDHLLLEEHLPVPDEHLVKIREWLAEAAENPGDETSVKEFTAEDW